MHFYSYARLSGLSVTTHTSISIRPTHLLLRIGHGQHVEEHGSLFSDWDADNRSAAQQILSSITTFEFILVFLLAYQHLSHLSGITIQLQSSKLEAHGTIKSIKDVYQTGKGKERTCMEGGFKVGCVTSPA